MLLGSPFRFVLICELPWIIHSFGHTIPLLASIKANADEVSDELAFFSQGRPILIIRLENKLGHFLCSRYMN